MKTIVTWQLPIKTASEANRISKTVVKKYKLRDGTELKIKKRKAESWREANRRHQEQKEKVRAKFLEETPLIAIPCSIVLTRIAPRSLDDDDNLPTSLKYVRDQVAAEITGDYRPGRADGDKRIKWQYKQEKGAPREYAVRIEIMSDD